MTQSARPLVHVLPAKGRRVRVAGRLIAVAGESLPPSQHLSRLIDDGDLVVIPPAKSKSSKGSNPA